MKIFNSAILAMTILLITYSCKSPESDHIIKIDLNNTGEPIK